MLQFIAYYGLYELLDNLLSLNTLLVILVSYVFPIVFTIAVYIAVFLHVKYEKRNEKELVVAK